MSQVTGIPDWQTAAWRAAVARWFSPSWLERGGSHPLRDLWRRDDWAAALEVGTLGDAIERVGGATPAPRLSCSRRRCCTIPPTR